MRRLTAISLISILTLASIGLNINAHICQGNVKSIGVFVPAQSCSTMANGSCSQQNHAEGFNKTPCCTDKCFATPQTLFESVDFLVPQSHQKTEPIVFESLIVFANHSNVFRLYEYEDDPPDRLVNKVQVLFQVFRI